MISKEVSGNIAKTKPSLFKWLINLFECLKKFVLFDLGMKTRTKKCVYIGFLTVSKEKQMHLVASCSYLGVNDKLLKQIVSTYARTHHWISKSNRTRLRAYWGRTIQLISNDHKYFFRSQNAKFNTV